MYSQHTINGSLTNSRLLHAIFKECHKQSTQNPYLLDFSIKTVNLGTKHHRTEITLAYPEGKTIFRATAYLTHVDFTIDYSTEASNYTSELKSIVDTETNKAFGLAS